MYSISKSFVAIAVGMAVEDGLLSLDDKMVKFFPEYANEYTNELLENMTIREMLTMETCKGKHTNWFTSGTLSDMESTKRWFCICGNGRPVCHLRP